MKRRGADVVVVGGGVAGLATGVALAAEGARTLLLEREPLLAFHASGRNAAIWLPAEDDPTTPELARRSADLLDARLGGREAWLATRGALLVAKGPRALDPAERALHRWGSQTRRVAVRELVAVEPLLRGGSGRAALWVPEAGVIDIHAVTQALASAVRRAGARIETGAGVARVWVEHGRVQGVVLEDGARVPAAAVVVAAGAWAASLGRTSRLPLPLEPLRRHLVHLAPAGEPGPAGPIVWSVGPGEVYFRPESGGVLASPCDETPWPPEAPPAGVEGIEQLARRLAALAPGLAQARVRRVWACLRTFAPDRELVVGPDPRARGLFWVAGLGGRGMTVGVAAGELAARLLAGRETPLGKVVGPERLLGGGPGPVGTGLGRVPPQLEDDVLA